MLDLDNNISRMLDDQKTIVELELAIKKIEISEKEKIICPDIRTINQNFIVPKSNVEILCYY